MRRSAFANLDPDAGGPGLPVDLRIDHADLAREFAPWKTARLHRDRLADGDARRDRAPRRRPSPRPPTYLRPETARRRAARACLRRHCAPARCRLAAPTIRSRSERCGFFPLRRSRRSGTSRFISRCRDPRPYSPSPPVVLDSMVAMYSAAADDIGRAIDFHQRLALPDPRASGDVRDLLHPAFGAHGDDRDPALVELDRAGRPNRRPDHAPRCGLGLDSGALDFAGDSLTEPSSASFAFDRRGCSPSPSSPFFGVGEVSGNPIGLR